MTGTWHQEARTWYQRQMELNDAYWRAANHLSVGQIYLLDTPLLREPFAGRARQNLGCSATGEPRPG
jgi:xylulose-5-phosphate/fructose-6-phosphate phosphoketolase